MIAVLTPLMTMLGPLAVLLLMAVLFAETGLLAGFFLPGDSLLFTAGVLIAAGAIHLPVWFVAVGAFAAAAAGDQAGYLLGRRFGPRVLNRRDPRWLSRDHIDRAHAFFDRHGPEAVLLARFVPVVRTLTPAIAGVASMPRRRFTAYNLAGALIWAVGLLVAGFFLGGVAFIANHIEVLALAVVAVSFAPAVSRLVRLRSLRLVGHRVSRGDPGVENVDVVLETGAVTIQRAEGSVTPDPLRTVLGGVQEAFSRAPVRSRLRGRPTGGPTEGSR
jgi:membrane-associated protein